MMISTTGRKNHRFLKMLSRTGRDSYSLTSSLLGAFVGKIGGGPPHSSSSSSLSSLIKDVLLKEAQRNQNIVAMNLLRTQQEYGLMRYYGFGSYLRRKIGSSTTSSFLPKFFQSKSRSSSSDSISLSSDQDVPTIASTSSSAPRRAKVAFMITSSMKQQLATELCYTSDEIKRMTPQQASLVLFHQVPPASFDDQINALEAEFQRQQDKESEEHQRQLAEAEKAAAFASAQRIQQQEEEEPEHQQQQNQERKQVENETKLASKILESLDDRKPELHEINNSCGGDTKSADTGVDHDRNRRSVRSESNMKSSAKTSTVFGQTCYEVVEVKDGTESRVGLYLDRDEAQLGMDTRQMIHDRRVDKRDSDENGSCEGESVYIVRQVSNDH